MTPSAGVPLPVWRRAVGAAVMAPSVHNTQPWRFVLDRDGLTVIADRCRQLPVLDPTGRQLLLSVGCAVGNACVSLAGSGFAAVIDRLPDQSRPDVAARIGVVDHPEPDPALGALEPAIARRQTNRRRFSDDPVPPSLIAELVAAAEGAVLHPLTDLAQRQAVARLSQVADQLQLMDPGYRAELRAWTNTEPGRRDGVPARVVPHVDTGAAGDLPLRDFDTHGAGWLPVDTGSTAQQCLLLLSAPADNAVGWLRAGEALERVWLHLTHAGYVASLFTQVIEVASTRAQLRAELGLNTHPQVLLRLGRAPLTAATSRRPLADVLDDRTEVARPSDGCRVDE